MKRERYLIRINLLIFVALSAPFAYGRNEAQSDRSFTLPADYISPLFTHKLEHQTSVHSAFQESTLGSLLNLGKYAFQWAHSNRALKHSFAKQFASGSLKYAHFDEKSFNHFNQLTHKQWKEYVNDAHCDTDIYTQWSLYQFKGFQDYLESLSNFKQEIIKLAGFEYYNSSDFSEQFNCARQNWCQQLSLLGCETAEKVYTYIHFKQLAIYQGRDSVIITGFTQPAKMELRARQHAREMQHAKIQQQKQDAYIAELKIVHENIHNRDAQNRTTITYEGSDRQQFDTCFLQAMGQVIAGDHTVKTIEYTLTVESSFILNDLALDRAAFAQCVGNAVQLQKHAEIVFIANEFGSLHEQTRFQHLSRTMYGFIDSARASNCEGNIVASCEITDFCWHILEYTHAVIAGVGDGLAAVANTLCNPITTFKHVGSSLRNASSFLAGLVCDMVECKIAFEQYNAGQFIGIEINYPSQECDRLFEKLSMIGKAFNRVYEEGCKKTGPERVRLMTALGTEFFVSGKVYGALARSAGGLYARAASELKAVIQNCKREMTAEQLIACAEGVEVKIAVETDLLMEKSVEKAGEVAGNNKFAKINVEKTQQVKNIEWANYKKHVPPPRVSWNDVIKSTKRGNAMYHPDINIEAIERLAWKQGLSCTNGKPWKVMKFQHTIGAKSGIETTCMRIEMSANTIHGHPITMQEYINYLKPIKNG